MCSIFRDNDNLLVLYNDETISIYRHRIPSKNNEYGHIGRYTISEKAERSLRPVCMT